MKKKNVQMKNCIKIFIVVILFIVLLFILYGIINNNFVAKYINKEYKMYNDIDNQFYDNFSCITFYKNGTYKENNCNDGFSPLPFSGKNCKKYKYDKYFNKITFYCDCDKDDPRCQDKIVTKVIKWDEDKLVFEYTDRSTNTKIFYK